MSNNKIHRIIKSLNPVAYAQWVADHRIRVLFIVVLMTLLFAVFIPRLSFKTSIHDLVIDDLPETAQYNTFKTLFGSEEIIRVVIKCDDVFDPLTFQKI